MERPGRAVEPGVAVVEHPAVGGHQPVPALAGDRRHADHRFVQRDAPRAAAEVLPEGEDPAVGGDGQVAVLRRRRVGGTGRAGLPPPTNPLSAGVVVELRPAAGFVGPARRGARHLEVLHDALHVARAPNGEVPGHRDADRPVGVGRDQCGVLEPEGLPGDAGVARPVVEVRPRRAGLAVEDRRAPCPSAR